MFVLFFPLVVEFTDVAVAYLDGRVWDAIIRLFGIQDIGRSEPAVKGIFGIYSVCANEFAEQIDVFLLQVVKPYSVFPIFPVGACLFDACCLLGIFRVGVYTVQELNKSQAIELSALVVESAPLLDNLMWVFAYAEFGQFVGRDSHSNFFCLRFESVLRQYCLPCLIVDVRLHFVVHIVSTCFNLHDFSELFACCFVLGVMNVVAFDASDIFS